MPIKARRRRSPVLGPAFDCDRMNAAERVRAYVAELTYYRPRGFSKLSREGERIARAIDLDKPDAYQHGADWAPEVEELLTAWARRVERHDFISFGSFPDSGDVGFSVDVESAMAEADLLLFLAREDTPPRGFTGLACAITDHGNVSAATYSRGRKCRELFAVV